VFDIGFSELLLIAVVALVVLGPERLPKAARFAGLWVRRARNQWDSVKQELERELHAEELKRNLQDVRQSMQQAEAGLRDQAGQVRGGVDAFKQEVEGSESATERVIEPRPIITGAPAEAIAPDAVDPAPVPVPLDPEPNSSIPQGDAPAGQAPADKEQER
jgi:sec-independent protein translocase protein TatB